MIVVNCILKCWCFVVIGVEECLIVFVDWNDSDEILPWKDVLSLLYL